MRYLVVVLVYLIGCQRQAASPKPLLVADNGYYRQYFWDGGDECGFVQGRRDRDGSTLLAGTHDRMSLRHFARFSDAVKWVEQSCPNAIPVGTATHTATGKSSDAEEVSK